MKNAVRKFAVASLVAASLCLTGCLSTTARVYGCWGEPYIGTQLALGYSGELPFLWADAPFEFVLDTALLPVDLIVMPFTDNGYTH